MASPSLLNPLSNLNTHITTVLKQTPHTLVLNQNRWVNPVTWIARPVRRVRLDNRSAKELSSSLSAN
ncbi:MAG TPA: hypothetical protein VE980_13675 [Pyrinomonadaceae bacterium]|nr:hypothetical protein [Pyrinomonadaceae bacterium]HYV11945.1 hypothetical protein [Pyrinomonadaceae bacterium]